MTNLRAVGFNCTLKPSPADSSCGLLLSDVMAQLAEHDVDGENAWTRS